MIATFQENLIDLFRFDKNSRFSAYSLSSKVLCILFFYLINAFANAQDIRQEIVSGIKIEKQLHANEKHSYTLKMKKTSCLDLTIKETSVDVAIDILSPEKKKIKTVSTYFTNGFEFISFIAPANGTYYFEVYPQIEIEGISEDDIADQKNRNQGTYEIIYSENFPSSEGIRRLKAKKSTIGWIKKNAIPLNSVMPSSGFEDLEPLKENLSDVQIVGLGEATHGTQEFFHMKHRMIEFLVKEMGFRIIAIEASFSACDKINSYIQNGNGEVRSIIKALGIHLSTNEFFDMIEWMKQYNSTVTIDKKIKLVGFDPQASYLGNNYQLIKDYIYSVDPILAKQKDSLLQMAERMNRGYRNFNTDSCKNKFLELVEYFETNKSEYIAKSSSEEYNNILLHLKISGQSLYLDLLRSFQNRNEGVRLRDNFMASNFKDLVHSEISGTKFIVWAHNGHVSKLEPLTVQNSQMFGNFLKETFGNKYYAVGFSFSKGSFQAYEFSQELRRQVVTELTVPETREDNLDWYFLQTGIKHFIIPFRGKKLPDYVKEFINKRFEARSIGAVANRYNADYITTTIFINRCYDAIVFIDDTKRATPLL